MDHEYFMDLALGEAQKARGKSFPNPSVGAVLVKKNSVVASGFTRPAGGNHAEVQAIKKAGANARGCSLYVTLEPCCHQGKTPPCTDLLIKSGIVNVFVGMVDPNPLVQGKGNRKLRNAGIKVKTGIRQGAVHEFYREYSFYTKNKRPYVYLKIAQSIEGSVNAKRGVRTSISHNDTQIHTHRLRNRVDAILVGGQTLRIDDPELIPWRVPARNRNYPECLVVTRQGGFSKNKKLFRSDRKSKTLIFSPGKRGIFKGIDIFQINSKKSAFIPSILSVLVKRGYHSVLVEAGPDILCKWIESGLWDSFSVICSSKSFPKGQKWTSGLSPNWQENLKFGKFTQFKEDFIWEFLPEN